MAITNREKYLKGIASLVHKGALHIEAEDRPVVMMGGRKVYISSVAFDTERDDLTYTVSNAKGEVIPSAHGERLLSGLDIGTLSGVEGAVRRYAAFLRDREHNLINVESRLKTVAKHTAPSVR